MGKSVSGTEPGQRQLNGPQTTGRGYRNLSKPQHEMTRDDDVAVPMRDGVHLFADIFRHDPDGSRGRVAAASQSHHARGGHLRFVRRRDPSWPREGTRLEPDDFSPNRHRSTFLLEHDLFQKPMSTLGPSPRAGFFGIML